MSAQPGAAPDTAVPRAEFWGGTSANVGYANGLLPQSRPNAAPPAREGQSQNLSTYWLYGQPSEGDFTNNTAVLPRGGIPSDPDFEIIGGVPDIRIPGSGTPFGPPAANWSNPNDPYGITLRQTRAAMIGRVPFPRAPTKRSSRRCAVLH